jgi:16S rRNA (cytidine1402-2'-O)-methyltransferase
LNYCILNPEKLLSRCNSYFSIMSGNLYLIPSTIGETDINLVIPEKVREVVNDIKVYIVENERTARRFLIKLGIQIPIDDITFYVLNKYTQKNELEKFLNPCTSGHVGLLSEAGVPAVADPGSDIVAMAHQKGIKVIPLVGPSSILLALMASGLNGQSFVFHGYLPVKPEERKKRIKLIEQNSFRMKQTQIFIEAPYRNNQMLKDLISTCNANTLICVACNLTQPDEFVKTFTPSVWKKQVIDLHKKPAIFLLQQI